MLDMLHWNWDKPRADESAGHPQLVGEPRLAQGAEAAAWQLAAAS